MKWFTEISKIYKHKGNYWILPCISLRYDKYHFLETGVETPALMLQISFLNFSWGLKIQKGY